MDRALPEDLPEWLRDFTAREVDEIKFAQMYAVTFAHGTDGHSRLILIAKLADKLNTSELLRLDPQALEPDLQAIEVPKTVIEIHSLMEKLQGR